MTGGRSTGVAIVGCGPAGIAAAIQLMRSRVDCVVFERKRVGGLLANANLIENYPGFPEGISGPDLVSLMERHLEAHAVRLRRGEVTRLSHSGDGFMVKAGHDTFRAETVIVATGTRPRSPEGIRIDPAARPRVLYEILPILDARDRDILIVGAGDAAFDYALNLGRQNRVKVLNRSDRSRCLPLLRERAEATPSIEYLESIEVLEVSGVPDGRISVRCRHWGEERMFDAHRLVFAIGREPELGLISGSLLEARDRLCEQGLLYFAGDVTRGERRQTAIAVGDGVRAAMEISDRLRMQAG